MPMWHGIYAVVTVIMIYYDILSSDNVQQKKLAFKQRINSSSFIQLLLPILFSAARMHWNVQMSLLGLNVEDFLSEIP